ncbi:MAG: hypothetical protein AB1529_07145 [Candidatus Micrarchaeota archaeon]
MVTVPDVRKRLFGDDAILRYPSLAPQSLRHEYHERRLGRSGKQLDFRTAVPLLDELGADVAAWYRKETGKEFDRYGLGDMADRVRARFWEDRRFGEAFRLLELDTRDITKVRVPWWNELAAAELGHSFDGRAVMVTIGPRHSIETQLVRSGVDVGISSISIGGIVETSDAFLAIGLRGGAAYPDTFHINAGALGLTAGIMSGEETIFGFYRSKELTAEFGLMEHDIRSVSLQARIMDRAIEDGPMYVFHVQTGLTFEGLVGRYEANKDEDKGEHTRLVPLRRDEIVEFIRMTYRGLVANKDKRREGERRLLHPGALALLSCTGHPLSVLEDAFREGVW